MSIKKNKSKIVYKVISVQKPPPEVLSKEGAPQT